MQYVLCLFETSFFDIQYHHTTHEVQLPVVKNGRNMKESNPSPMSHLAQELTCIMNRANQQQLFQATNQGLLGIRQLEINYYQGLNVAFGTQAALIGGFTYGVFSLNIINHGNGYRYLGTLVDLCWTSSAVTIALSIHVILCTMLMQVLGPGLALNGPVGSMTRATEGMRLELKQIIISFVAMMIFFSISTVLSCWMVMSFEGAVGCTLAFVAAAYYWYYYCERIYLRFYWEREEAGWNPRESILNQTELTQKTTEYEHQRRKGYSDIFDQCFRLI